MRPLVRPSGAAVRCGQMKSNLENEIRTALAQVQDPELHDDLVSLDMIGGVRVEGDRAAVTVTTVVEGWPHRGQVEREIRQALAGTVAADSLDVTFSPLFRPPAQEPLPGVGHIVSVGSGKGGVGKSTVAANIAASLAREGARVGLLDADIYGPSQARMFDVEGKRLMADDEKRIMPLSSHGLPIISIANLVEDGEALTWRGPILHGTLSQMLKQTLWGELDYMIVD